MKASVSFSIEIIEKSTKANEKLTNYSTKALVTVVKRANTIVYLVNIFVFSIYKELGGLYTSKSRRVGSSNNSLIVTRKPTDSLPSIKR